MEKSESKTLPRFRSLNDLVEFFDTHDLGEYENEMPPSHFEVDIKKREHFFALDPELAGKLSEIAHERRTASEQLINSWLREKILEMA